MRYQVFARRSSLHDHCHPGENIQRNSLPDCTYPPKSLQLKKKATAGSHAPGSPRRQTAVSTRPVSDRTRRPAPGLCQSLSAVDRRPTCVAVTRTPCPPGWEGTPQSDFGHFGRPCPRACSARTRPRAEGPRDRVPSSGHGGRCPARAEALTGPGLRRHTAAPRPRTPAAAPGPASRRRSRRCCCQETEDGRGAAGPARGPALPVTPFLLMQ